MGNKHWIKVLDIQKGVEISVHVLREAKARMSILLKYLLTKA